MSIQAFLLYSMLLTAALLLQTGCSQQQGSQVTGTVTLDGQPLSSATVKFIPTSSAGRIATGRTESNGAFKLTTSKSVSNVFPADYKVKITTSIVSGTSDADLKKTPEKVPVKYNKKTELVRTVEDGPNQLDFKLLTK